MTLRWVAIECSHNWVCVDELVVCAPSLWVERGLQPNWRRECPSYNIVKTQRVLIRHWVGHVMVICMKIQIENLLRNVIGIYRAGAVAHRQPTLNLD